MPITYVDEYGSTVTEPTELEYLEYEVSQRKAEMGRARDELDPFWSRLELVSERIRTLIANGSYHTRLLR
jgi:hypothetical protein